MTGSQEFIATTYRMIIGAGGAGAIDGITGRGVSGSSTLITSSVQGTLYTAIGGGGGGGYPYASDGDGGDGGSGGGGQSYSSTVTGLALQPFLSGSSGLYGNGSDGAPAFNGSGTGGGGGGAGGLAPSGIPNFDSYINGADGLGVLNFLTSSLTSYYGGGGGGANDCANPTSGSGGLGGGGRGETCNIPGETGSANTGGGGGGGGGGFEDGGNGGSGIIYVKYRYTVYMAQTYKYTIEGNTQPAVKGNEALDASINKVDASTKQLQTDLGKTSIESNKAFGAELETKIKASDAQIKRISGTVGLFTGTISTAVGALGLLGIDDEQIKGFQQATLSVLALGSGAAQAITGIKDLLNLENYLLN
jgi:hypothetical protein